MGFARAFLNLKLCALLASVALLAACGQIGGSGNTDAGGNQQAGSITTGGGGTNSGDGTVYKPTPLLWETQAKDGLLWSSFVYQIIGNSAASSLLPGSSDITDFCPAYASTTDPERVNFWGYLISAIAKYESAFNPSSRYLEGTLGTDHVTNQPVYSEGLLQLSYQDIEAYPFCEFNWLTDKLLSATDPKKSILDPFKNLECGIKILAEQIATKGKIGLTSGVYWSTLKSSGKFSKLQEIEAMTRSLPFCKD